MIILSTLLLMACSGSSQILNTTAEDLSVKEFYQSIQKEGGHQLLDVRTPEEWVTGYIKGAQKMNWFDADFVEQVKSTNLESRIQR